MKQFFDDSFFERQDADDSAYNDDFADMMQGDPESEVWTDEDYL